MIPASLDGPKPRAAPLEGLLDAEGLGTDPVDDPPDEGWDEDEEFPLVALSYGDRTSVTKEKRAGSAKRTLNSANVLLAVGLTAKTMPARQCLGGNISTRSDGKAENVHSRPLFAKEPQRSGGIFNSEAPLRDRCGVGRDRLVVGINASGQSSARIVEARLGSTLAKEASGRAVEKIERVKLTWFLVKL